MMSRACYLRPAIRELDRVLALGGVVSLALCVMMNISRVGVGHVVSEVIIRWHLNTRDKTTTYQLQPSSYRIGRIFFTECHLQTGQGG